MKLSELKKNQTGKIISVGGDGALRQHFLDMGVIPGTEISYIKSAPMGDPIEYRIWGYELTLRIEDGAEIEIELLDDGEKDGETAEKNKAGGDKKRAIHPGLGEMGIYHVKQKGEKLKDDEIMTFGLAGNQNSGKTTLFNQLTGSNQHVGNFPGVTVDRKDGQIREKEYPCYRFAGNIFPVTVYK